MLTMNSQSEKRRECSPSSVRITQLISSGVDQRRSHHRLSAPTTENALGLTIMPGIANPDEMAPASCKSDPSPPQYVPLSDGATSIGESADNCISLHDTDDSPPCLLSFLPQKHNSLPSPPMPVPFRHRLPTLASVFSSRITFRLRIP